MSHPRISVFASSAKGEVAPIRTIQGQATLQARTAHQIAVDPIHDEIVVPNPFAETLLFFRADAGGNEKPLRIIQGPKTLLGGSLDTDNVAVSPIHNEVYTAQRSSNAILAFNRAPGGDVAPIRVLHGPKTQLRYPVRVTVDSVNDLLAVTSGQGILLFNRTDNGDVAPRCVISGPKTGLPEELNMRTTNTKALLNPNGKKIIFGGGQERSWGESRTPVEQRRQGSFLAIWNYGDCGDVPPLYRFNFGDASFELLPETKELVTTDDDQLKFYDLPEAF